MHLGHKLLLTSAASYTKRKMYIGITATKLLMKKTHSQFLEEFSIRKARVEGFL